MLEAIFFFKKKFRSMTLQIPVVQDFVLENYFPTEEQFHLLCVF